MDIKEIESALVKIELPVLWGDMDAFNHVNNTVYIKWIESARVEMLQKINDGTIHLGAIIPILAYINCKYLFPVTYPDTVIVTFDVTTIKEDRILGTGKIYSKKHNRIVAISNNTLMTFDSKEGKKLPFLDQWKQKIIEFYGENILIE